MTVWRIIYILAFLIAPTSAILGADANQPKSDIRVLVDISGSMKQNDPQNLRVPAIQLFSQLLPENSRAGVWAFGEYVNMTVPLDDVSKAWKQMAMRTTREIDSSGLYTNLGSAIERATFGWSKADPNSKRSLIILTDGMVDVSPNQEVNDRARREILRETLPALREAGVVIHTIALAGDADESLMAQLSAQTDGWYQKIAVADQLQEAFLKIFGQATEQDSIPLDNNSFLVDDQITEFTLVLFKTGAAKPVQLEKPDGERFDASKDTAEVSWYEGTDYDLITVSKPMVGKWRVEAEIDPKNRVLVVSNIKVNPSLIPNNLLATETFDFSIQMMQQDQAITDSRFLGLLKVEMDILTADTDDTLTLQDTGKAPDNEAGDGTFTTQIVAPQTEGVAELTMMVSSPTFQRLRQKAVNIFDSPVIIEHILTDDTENYHQIFLTPREPVVEPDSLEIKALITMPDGEEVPVTLSVDAGFRQVGRVTVFESGGQYQLQLSVTGKTQNGRQFSVNTQPYIFETPILVAPEPEVVTEPMVAEKVVEPEPEIEIDWVYWFTIGAIINVTFLLLGFAVTWLNKRRAVAYAKKLTAELELPSE